MNRIRYKQITETTKQSIQTFGHPTNGAQYIVRLTPEMWMVLDAETEVPATTGYVKNKAEDLKSVKRALLDLGINLPIERRKPRVKKQA